jgi:putative FmdB family regulatory protein
MPLYEYDCPKCGRFEVLQRMSARPLAKHECGNKVKKIMSAGVFAFKGSGFYQTDYKKVVAPACQKPRSAACGGCPSNGTAAA